jgi:FMN reductase
LVISSDIGGPTVPSGWEPNARLFALEDWGATELGERIGRAAAELAAMLRADVEAQIADHAWSGYQHQIGGNATRAERPADDVVFDSPLMRLAAGGRPAAAGRDAA